MLEMEEVKFTDEATIKVVIEESSLLTVASYTGTVGGQGWYRGFLFIEELNCFPKLLGLQRLEASKEF